MMTLAKETCQIIRRNLKSIIIFEVLYRFFTVPVYLHLIDRLLQVALKMGGYSYLTAGNIGYFLIKPWTILAVLAAGIVGVFFLSLEIAGLLTAFQGSAYQKKLTPFHMLVDGAKNITDAVRRKNFGVFPVLLMDCFLSTFFLIYRVLTHVKPVNFMLRELWKEPAGRAGTVALLLISIVVMIPTMFLCHESLIGGRTFQESLKRSRELVKGRLWSSISLLVLFHAVVIGLFFFLYLLGVFAAAVFTVLFTDQKLALAVLLFVSDRLELLLIFIASMAVMVVYFAALTVFYFQYGCQLNHGTDWDFGKKETKKRRLAVLAVVLTGAVSIFYIFDLVQNGSALSGDMLSEIQITAHRGSSKTAPENTMAAMEAAVRDLADYAEIDVQLTSDGVIVLAHDASLKRVAGINRTVGSMTWEELNGLDVGSWFSEEYAGERIPTLEQVLEYCKGKLNLNIELKSIGKGSPLPELVVGQIVEYGMEQQCVITSVSLEYLRKVKALEPELRTGYIISAAYGDFYSDEAVDFISIRSSFVDERLVKRAHEQGRAIHAWTVNSKSEIERLMLLGIDNVITDYPVLAREIIYREQASETLMEYLKIMFH